MAEDPTTDPSEDTAGSRPARPRQRRRRPTRRHVLLSVAIGLIGATLSYVILSAVMKDDQPEGLGTTTLEETRPAPDTKFPKLDGGETSLAEYEGKPVVLNFFAESCIPCRKEMPDLERVHQEIGDTVSLVGIDQGDTEEVAKAFVKEMGVTYDTGRDPSGDLAREFKVDYLPGTVFITRSGDIAAVHRGQLSYDELREMIDKYLL